MEIFYIKMFNWMSLIQMICLINAGKIYQILIVNMSWALNEFNHDKACMVNL